MGFFYSAVTRTEDIKTMVYFIQQSLEQRISKQWVSLFNSHQNKGYQNNGIFYSTVTRTKDIKTMVSFIQQSLELMISKQWFLLFKQSLELMIATQWFLLFKSHQNNVYQNNGFFFSTATITEDIKTMVYFIEQSLEQRI